MALSRRDLLIEYLERRQLQLAEHRAKLDRDPLRLAFGQQRAAIECNAKQVALRCSGRAGKTRGFLLKWLKVAEEKPGWRSAYVALTQESAKNILWGQVYRLNVEFSLGLTPRVSDREWVHPNGSILWLAGANRAEDIEKLRGFPMPLCGIDEAQSHRDALLKELIHAVIEPRLADLDGEQWILGTPGPTPVGFFYRATTGKLPGWTTFHWAFLDNPHLPLNLPGKPQLGPNERLLKRIEYLKELRKRNGWDRCQTCGRHEDEHPPSKECDGFLHHPTYQREWLGLWVRDESALVYSGFRREWNLIDAMPDDYLSRLDQWIHVLGHDYGVTNETAWNLWAFRGYGDRPEVYGVRSEKRAGLSPSQAADRTKELREKHRVDAMVGDAGGIGKAFIAEGNVRHQLPVETAEKTEKRAYIEHMNGDFRSKRVLLVENSNLDYISELETLPWEPFPEDDPRWHTREDPRFPNHLCDGGLYGWRRCTAYFNTEEEPPPPPGRDDPKGPWIDEDDEWAERAERERAWWDG